MRVAASVRSGVTRTCFHGDASAGGVVIPVRWYCCAASDDFVVLVVMFLCWLVVYS